MGGGGVKKSKTGIRLESYSEPDWVSVEISTTVSSTPKAFDLRADLSGYSIKSHLVS